MKFTTKISMSEFGFQSNAQAPAFEAGHKFMQYVAPKKDYFFRQELLRPLMNWLYTPCGDSALLVGPTGSGKSSLVEQLTARLNWPCLTVSAHSRMEMPELTGYNLPVTDPVSGDLNTRFVDGPLTRAMRHGFVFVLDEYDTLDPAVTVGLHAVLEGRPWSSRRAAGKLCRRTRISALSPAATRQGRVTRTETTPRRCSRAWRLWIASASGTCPI